MTTAFLWFCEPYFSDQSLVTRCRLVQLRCQMQSLELMSEYLPIRSNLEFILYLYLLCILIVGSCWCQNIEQLDPTSGLFSFFPLHLGKTSNSTLRILSVRGVPLPPLRTKFSPKKVTDLGGTPPSPLTDTPPKNFLQKVLKMAFFATKKNTCFWSKK